MTVSGDVDPAGATSPMWNVGGELDVGQNDIGTLTVQDGGRVSKTTGQVGERAGGTGSVTVFGTDANGNASLWENSVFLSVGSSGTGTLTIEGGGRVTSTHGCLGVDFDAVGTVTVSGTDANGNASSWANDGELYVGFLGAAKLNVEEGAEVTSTHGYVGGWSAGASGTVTVSGTNANGNASTWSNSSYLAVGVYGDGTLTIADGGEVSVGTGGAGLVDLAWDAGISGTISIGAAAGEAAVAAGTLEAARVRFGDGVATLAFNTTAPPALRRR